MKPALLPVALSCALLVLVACGKKDETPLLPPAPETQKPAKPAPADQTLLPQEKPTLAPGVTGKAVDESEPAESPKGSSALLSPNVPQPLATLAALGQATIEQTFDTELPGITGFLVQQDGQYTILYGSNGYLFAGALVNPAGRNLTADYLEQYAPKPNYESVVAELAKDKSVFAAGPESAPTLYVFIDPNCPYCKQFHEESESLVRDGKLRVRYVMVGFLRPTSVGLSAAVLSSDKPLDVLDKHFDNFATPPEKGGVVPLAAPGPDLESSLKRHLDEMEKVGGSGTPTVIFKTADGKWVAKFGNPGSEWLRIYAEQGHG